MARKKVSHIPLIDAMTIYKTIAKRSDISYENVKKVFEEYYNLYEYSVMHKVRLTLPNIGDFRFDKIKRKEKGTIVNRFKVVEGELNENGKPLRVMVKEPLDHDIPAFLRSRLVIRKNIQQKVRKVTEELL